jgi:hypothetical protein
VRVRTDPSRSGANLISGLWLWCGLPAAAPHGHGLSAAVSCGCSPATSAAACSFVSEGAACSKRAAGGSGNAGVAWLR